jgi:uncharacterized protein YrzB (UPF0473 family)
MADNNHVDDFEMDGEFESDTIMLKDENGEEHEFEVLGIVDVDEFEYAILYPLDSTDEDEAIAFRIEKDGDEETLVIVDDEEELRRVQEVWESTFESDEQ